MKRLCFGFAVLLAGLAGLLLGPVTWAEPNDATYQNVSLNCEGIRLRLKQVRVNDSLTRVNYGQAYESLIEKVMTPANTRLVANRYDASELVGLTTRFNSGLQHFRETYRNYKNKLDELIALDCKNNPVEFYNKLEVVRSARSDLGRQLEMLDGQMNVYKVVIREAVDGQ